MGPNVQLLTPTHPVHPELRRAKWEAALPITIGDNVWIGGMAMICPGVTVGENSIIRAGAVVTKDIPADVWTPTRSGTPSVGSSPTPSGEGRDRGGLSGLHR